MTSYSSIAPPPMRGFVVRPIQNDEWEGDMPCFSTKRVPIVGVVVKTVTDDAGEGWGAYATILPVIYDPTCGTDTDGGMTIYEHMDCLDPAFSVVWCYWPPEEDERRFVDIHEFVAKENQEELRRQSQRHRERKKGN